MENIIYKLENGVGYIILNIPEKANAMTAELKEGLYEILHKVRNDDAVRAIVITGKGPVFCAGGDLSTMGNKQSVVQGRERMKHAADWVKELTNMEKPTIACVNGAAFGGGLSLALACDFIFASRTAKFSCSFVKIGLIADTGALYFLPRRVGMAHAKHLVITGEVLSAAEGHKIGLVDEVLPPEELDKYTNEFAEKLARSATYAIGMNKRIINQSFEMNLNALLDMEASFQAVAFQTADHKNAVKTFFGDVDNEFTGK